MINMLTPADDRFGNSNCAGLDNRVLNTAETLITCEWTYQAGKLIMDDNFRRIEWLTKDYLTKISTTDSGWTANYQDPADGRYWQLTYPNSHMQGGGPPMLKCIGLQDDPIFPAKE